MTTTVQQLLWEHPQNIGHNPLYPSSTDKKWTSKFAPIHNLRVHTRIEVDGSVSADFDAFLPEYSDEMLRATLPSNRPNAEREWYLSTEEDGKSWLNTEVSNVTLSAFTRYPSIRQELEAKALTEVGVAETVDIMYTLRAGARRAPVAIGEMKRNLVRASEWQSGRLRGEPQLKLSRELRGYAIAYKCPQVLCFDIGCLIVLQFRAQKEKEMTDPKLQVDCWVFPRDLQGRFTLRYVLYRLLVQGIRRCQGLASSQVSVGGLTPAFRQYYSGKPMWSSGKFIQGEHPDGYVRDLDPSSGALFWMKDGTSVLDHNNQPLWDTIGLWELFEAAEPEQSVQDDDAERGEMGMEVIEEDIYGA